MAPTLDFVTLMLALSLQKESDVFTRYAIYYTPPKALADKGAAWLGWDLALGACVAHPDLADLAGLDVAALTKRPRKYGMHGTVKAPFALVAGTTQADLENALGSLCQDLSSVTCEGLEVATLGRFLALVPVGDQTALQQMAARVVEVLDPFRAPLSAGELARRRQARLSDAQDANLQRWGYPHVMGQFRFHITLTGPVSRGDLAQVAARVAAYFAPDLPRPFVIDRLTLVGERPDGNFETVAQVGFGTL